MKRILFTFGLLLQVLLQFAQNREIDSLKRILKAEKTDSGKAEILNDLSYAYGDSRPDSSLLLAQQVYFISKNIKYIKGELKGLGQMAAAYKSLGNFPKSLEYYIEKLKLDEANGSLSSLTFTYLSIASLYDDTKEFDKGLYFAKKAESIINENKPETKLQTYAPYVLLDLGDIYEKKNILDSAIMYTSKCLSISRLSGDTLLVGTALNNLGNIYYKSGNYTEALKYYYESIPYELSSGNYSTYVESTLGMAKVYTQTGRMDSAFWYGKKSFDISNSNQFTVRALKASVFLSGLYKQSKNIDSAFAYQEIVTALKDSIESSEKIRELQNIGTAEQLRQAELEQQKLEQIKDREEKLQLLVIGIMIPIFFLISVVISRRKVHKKLIEFTGIVSVLLFFEYITLLLHPFIAEKSHHSPVIEIIIFVCIAAILTPLHHKIQHWLVTKLAEYNYLKHHKSAIDMQNNITEKDEEETWPSSVI
jgi:tetratricopeptide (TPR) repeat protein